MTTLARADLEAKVAEMQKQLDRGKIGRELELEQYVETLTVKVAELSEEKRKLIEAVADHVTVRSEQHSRIVELEEENAAAKAVIEIQKRSLHIQEQQIKEQFDVINYDHPKALAASQAREKGLRDAIDQFGHNKYCSRGIAIIENRNTTAECTCQMRVALSTPTDDTALREYCAAEVAKEREACAKACEKERVQIVVDGLEERAYNNAVNDCADAIRARADKIRKGEAL